MGINSLRLTLSSPGNNYHHSCTENIVRIGRSLNCEFNIPREDLSREHCQVEIVGDDVYITDLGSKNGVTVDRVRIEANTKVKISNSSLVVLSNLYTLKLNALEVKTKADMLYSKPAAPDIETVTFQLDLPQKGAEKPKRLPIRRTTRLVSEETASTASNMDSVKMILAFLAVLAVILYQALGR